MSHHTGFIIGKNPNAIALIMRYRKMNFVYAMMKPLVDLPELAVTSEDNIHGAIAMDYRFTPAVQSYTPRSIGNSGLAGIY
jgi:hypothetical protein